MKFKLDENLEGAPIVSLLADGGHDVATVRAERLGGATDEDVQRAAPNEDRALITLDLDFSNPLRFPTSRTAGIAVIRVPRPLLSLIESTLRSILPRLKDGAIRGHLWIIEPGRIREYASADEPLGR